MTQIPPESEGSNKKFLITLGEPAEAMARQMGARFSGPVALAVLLPPEGLKLGFEISVTGTVDGERFDMQCYTEGQSPLYILTARTAVTGEITVTRIGAMGRRAEINGCMSAVVVLYAMRGSTRPVIEITDVAG